MRILPATGLPIVEVGLQTLVVRPDDTWGQTFCGMLSIMETAEVIRRARFFIGIDSGPAHLANAVKTPGVVLLGRMGYFRQYTPFTGFYAGVAPEVRLVRNLTGVTAEIPVQEVVEAIRYLTHIPDTRDL